MDPKIIKNILVMLDRVQVTGKEAAAWCEAVGTLEAMLKEATTPVPVPSPPPADDSHAASSA